MVLENRARRGRDVLTRFTDQALVSAGNFLVGVLVARSVGPTQFGVFALFWTIVMFTLNGTWALAIAPLQSMLPSIHSSRRGSLLTALMFVISGLALMGALAGAIVAVRTTTAALSIEAASTFFAVVFFVAIQDFSRRWLLATERAQLALIGDGLRHIPAIAALLYLGRGELPSSMTILALAAALGCLPLVSQFQISGYNAASRIHATSLFRIGRWLVPSIVLQSVASSTPVYALGIESGIAAAGGYRAIFNLLSPIISLTEALETFLPLRSRQAMIDGGIGALRHVLWRWWWPLQLVCASFGIGVWLLGPAILRLVYGAAYLGYLSMLPALAVALSLQFASYILHVALRALDRARDIPRADVVATGTLILLFLFFPLGKSVLWAAIYVALSQAIKVAVWGFHARALVTTKLSSSRN